MKSRVHASSMVARPPTTASPDRIDLIWRCDAKVDFGVNNTIDRECTSKRHAGSKGNNLGVKYLRFEGRRRVFCCVLGAWGVEMIPKGSDLVPFWGGILKSPK